MTNLNRQPLGGVTSTTEEPDYQYAVDPRGNNGETVMVSTDRGVYNLGSTLQNKAITELIKAGLDPQEAILYGTIVAKTGVTVVASLFLKGPNCDFSLLVPNVGASQYSAKEYTVEEQHV